MYTCQWRCSRPPERRGTQAPRRPPPPPPPPAPRLPPPSFLLPLVCKVLFIFVFLFWLFAPFLNPLGHWFKGRQPCRWRKVRWSSKASKAANLPLGRYSVSSKYCLTGFAPTPLLLAPPLAPFDGGTSVLSYEDYLGSVLCPVEQASRSSKRSRRAETSVIVVIFILVCIGMCVRDDLEVQVSIAIFHSVALQPSTPDSHSKNPHH